MSGVERWSGSRWSSRSTIGYEKYVSGRVMVVVGGGGGRRGRGCLHRFSGRWDMGRGVTKHGYFREIEDAVIVICVEERRD